MSARVLKYTLIRRHPDTLQAEALLAGTEVPEWAKDLVEDDDLTDGTKSDTKSSSDSGSDAGSGKGSKKSSKKSDKSDKSDKGDPGDPGTGGDNPPAAPAYGKQNNADLEAEIAKRNEGRDDDAKIVPDGTTKAALVAALEADDATQASE